MSKSRPFVTCGLFLISLTALLSWSVPSRADEPDPAEAIRQIGIMARVLETRLNEEIPGAIVGGSIFQPGGVRGFRVPGVGVVFEINVNFPVVEPKAGERSSAAAKNEDLWNRIERGEIVGPGVAEAAYGYYSTAPAPATPPAPGAPGVPGVRPAPPTSAVPSAPDAVAATPAQPHAPGAPAPPHAPVAPVPPHAPVAPVPPHAVVGSITGGYGGGAGPYGYGGGRESRRNIATLERVILDALARYGERLKAIPANESIIVLVAGGGPRGQVVVRRGTSAAQPEQPRREAELPGEAWEQIKDQMKAADERMRDVQAQMDAAVAQKAQAQQSDNAAAIEQAEAQVQAAKDRIQATAQQMRAAGEQVKATSERARAAQSTRSTRPSPRRAANVAQPTATGLSLSVAEVGAPGGGSWVLKVKKGDLVSDPDQLRKRVVIESY